MISKKKFYRFFQNKHIGCGGWKCPCCAPAPGKARKTHMRKNKRGCEKEFFNNYIKETLLDQ